MQKHKLYSTITQFIIAMWLPAGTLVMCAAFQRGSCSKGIHSMHWARLWKYYYILYPSILVWEVIDITFVEFLLI